jgi:hypothetical protein
MLVGNAVTTGHHARAVSSNYSLERKINKKKTTKALNGIGNTFIHDKVQLTLYRVTHMYDLHFPVITAPLAQTFLTPSHEFT